LKLKLFFIIIIAAGLILFIGCADIADLPEESQTEEMAEIPEEPLFDVPRDYKHDNIEIFEVSCNCYFLINRETKEVVIIDPGDRFVMLRNACNDNGLIPAAILFTHGHIDHIAAGEDLRRALQAPVYSWHEEEYNFFNNAVMKNITWFTEETVLELAGFKIEVIHTPGHTIGSVCYYIKELNILFSGDTMFRQTYGRTDFETGNYNEIVESFRDKLFVLPGGTIVYPGHGEITTVSFEKQNNPMSKYINNK